MSYKTYFWRVWEDGNHDPSFDKANFDPEILAVATEAFERDQRLRSTNLNSMPATGEEASS